MTTQEKRDKLKSLVNDIFNDVHNDMLNKIDRVINSGSIPLSDWNEEDKPMVLPKCIVSAILEHESQLYAGHGTSFHKRNKKIIKNIQYFI